MFVKDPVEFLLVHWFLLVTFSLYTALGCLTRKRVTKTCHESRDDGAALSDRPRGHP